MFPYRQLVGSLMYLAVGTRPDISFAIGSVSRYLEKPTVVHEKALKRILKYLRGTMNFGILYKRGDEQCLKCYSDADYGGDVDTRRSTSGTLVTFNGSAISWFSSRQKSVSLSTTESEYIAASEAVKELVWQKLLFAELVNKGSYSSVLFMDNQSAIRLVKNPEFHKRTKHIDIRYHFIREKFEEGEFDLQFISTHEMVADICTKALPKERFQYLRSLTGLIPKEPI